jgi:hypothetical protein
VGVGAVGSVAEVHEAEGEDKGYEEHGCKDDLDMSVLC